MSISINSTLPANFYCQPNDQRSKTQLMRWWNNPFIVKQGNSFQVHCLDGGAWDRPTVHSHYDTLSQALHHAQTLKESLKDFRYKGGAL